MEVALVLTDVVPLPMAPLLMVSVPAFNVATEPVPRVTEPFTVMVFEPSLRLKVLLAATAAPVRLTLALSVRYTL